jgi:hypothetical protein
MERVLQKVHGPELIRPLCFGNFDARLSCQFLSSADPYFEVFLPINALRSLLVYFADCFSKRPSKSETKFTMVEK